MVIKKILNNNVIVSSDEQGQEIILMGRGLAFKMKIGDEVAQDKVEKMFTLSTPEMVRQFQELLIDIPIDHVKLADEVIKYIKVNYGKKLSSSIYLTLTDHLHSAILRSQENIQVKNVMLWDIKRFYKDEYAIAEKIVQKINEKCDIELPDDEVGFIAMHIVNASIDNESDDIFEMTKLMTEITNIVKYHFRLNFDEDSVYYYRFITHLKFFAQRLINKKAYEGTEDKELLQIIRKKYHNAYQCVEVIAEFVSKMYDYQVSDEEKLYLTIHIAKIVQETLKKD